MTTDSQTAGPSILIHGHFAPNRGSAAMLDVTTQELKARLGNGCSIGSSDIRGPFQAIVDLSGYGYSDALKWGDRNLKSAEHLKRRHPNAKWVFLPQAFGPFHDTASQERYRSLFKEAVICARGVHSCEALRQLDPALDVVSATDVTWLLKADSSRTEAILRDLVPNSIRPLVGIGPNLRIYERDHAYLERLGELCERLQKWADVLLIPHEFKDYRRDDRWLCQALGRPYVEEALSPQELKALIGRCGLFLGSRYHGLIAAISSGVPSLAIGWSEKYGDLLDEFDLRPFDLTNASIAEAEARITQAWDDRVAISGRLRQEVERKKQQTSALFDRIASEIKTRVLPSDRFLPLREPLSMGIRQNKRSASGEFTSRRLIHRLEKGLCLARSHSPPRVFGQQLANSLLAAIRQNGDQWEASTRNWALSVLDQYCQMLPESHEATDYQELRNRVHAGRVQELYRAADRPASPDQTWIERLFAARRSVRSFLSHNPDPEVVKSCVSLALQSPSACNRQAFRILYFDDLEIVDRIVNIPLGAKGQKVPGIFVFVGRYEGYSEARDVKCPIIDASLAAMSLMYALQVAGLSTLPINFPEIEELNADIRRVCGLKESEIVVLLLGVGQADPNAWIATSPKRSVDDVLAVNPPATIDSSAPPGREAPIVSELPQVDGVAGCGVIMFNRGEKCLVRMLVCLHSLRKWWSGPVTLYLEGKHPPDFLSAVDKLNAEVVFVEPSPAGNFTRKTEVSLGTPYDRSLWLDNDTLVCGPIEEIFQGLDTHELVTPHFAGWKTDKRLLRSRILQYRGLCPDEWLEKAVEAHPAVNGGVYAFRRDASILPEWLDLTRRGDGRVRLTDEVALQVLLPRYSVGILPSKFNVSVKFPAGAEDARIIHYHGRKHVGRFPLCERWKAAFQEARAAGLLVDSLVIRTDRKARCLIEDQQDVTVVTACDEKYLDKLRLTFPTWERLKKITRHPVIVFVHGIGSSDPRLDFLRHPRVTLIPWDFPVSDQREKMLSAFVFGVAEHVKTPWWLKLDADAFATDDRPLLTDEMRRYSIFGHRWGYSFAAHIQALDEWAGAHPQLRADPMFDPGCVKGRRYYHRRTQSFIQFEKTELTKRAASLAGARLPVPSQDTYLYYIARAYGEPIGSSNFKKHHGMGHCSSVEDLQKVCVERGRLETVGSS